jgi:hypothetical protein
MVAALGNSTLPTSDKLNSQRDAVIGKLEERIGVLESRLMR